MEFNNTCGFNINQTNYYWFDNGLSDEELFWIDNLKNIYAFDKVESVADKVTKKIRLIGNKDNVLYDKNCFWLYDKLKTYSIEANNMIWGFNIHSIIEPIKYVEYLEGGQINWHMDIGYGSYRKITIISQLSESKEYEGGDIEIWMGEVPFVLPKIKGSVILFPSFLLYRITPVTSGVKKILEFHICGESFK